MAMKTLDDDEMMEVFIRTIKELGRAPEPEVLRLIDEHRKGGPDPLGGFIGDLAEGLVEANHKPGPKR